MGRRGQRASIPDPAPSAERDIPADPSRVTIARAIQVVTAKFAEHAAPNTQKKDGLLLKKVRAFSEGRGYVMLDQWGPIDVREFRSSRSVKPQTAAKNMSTIKAFFEFCLSNEWITRNRARLVKNPRGRDAADRRNERKLPFTDAELQKVYEGCETKYGKQEVKWSRTIHHQRVEGEYVDRMQPTGEIHVRTTKAWYARLHLGARVVAGTHPRPRPRIRSGHLR